MQFEFLGNLVKGHIELETPSALRVRWFNFIEGDDVR